jgi:YggT family protein
VRRVDVNRFRCLFRQVSTIFCGNIPDWPKKGRSMRAVLDVVLLALQIYVWILIASAVLSWLIAFNVINTRNQFVATVWDMLYRMTEPVLRPIRERLPNMGGIDISPIILLLIIYFIQSVIIRYIYPNVF